MNAKNNFNKYFFTIYPNKNSQTPYILNVNTANKEYLKINCSEVNSKNMIKKEASNDYANSNISSVFFYENEYIIKTCFGSNKIVEIKPQNETNSQSSIYFSDNKNISKDFIYCYSTIINNPDSKNPKFKAVITYWVEELSNENKYSHKCILFYLDSKKFSQPFELTSSSSLFQISKKYPQFCTTFREKDIFCSYYDENLNNQFAIETNKLKSKQKLQEIIHFVLSDFGQIKGNNMKPIALNKQMKSLLGGYYDVFLAEFHNNVIHEKNSTVLLYSLYRKSLHASIVPMFANLELFFGTNIKDAYVEMNLFNFILESNEIILFFVYKNHLRIARIDYSVENNLFKSFEEIENLGYYSAKLENCKIPKYMQSTYIINLIKYNSTEQEIVNKNKGYYLYEQDIALLLSCSNSEEENNEEVQYNPFIIDFPQCINYLDSLNGNSVHKINFFLNINEIIYDIYRDPPLKSFKNVGIMFYPYERYYLGLLFLTIKLQNSDKYIVAQNNVIYENITHISFKRVISRFVPIFTKPFYLKYRLFKNETNSKVENKLASNVCFFQIKFFPYEKYYYSSSSEGSDEKYSMDSTIDSTYIGTYPPDEPEEPEICDIDLCAICIKEENQKEFTCQICDTSELEVIVRDDNKESDTYGKCICDVNLNFYKDPIENTCACQEDYAYYKTTNLCWPKQKLETGPYYIKAIDDITEIPIYDDCYYSCKKCSVAGDAKKNNCEECKDGFAYLDDDKSNCIDEKEIGPGYHEEEPGHYIKCHDNCISCIDKPMIDENNNVIKQYCTECKNYVPYFIREKPNDEYFNCFETKCDENIPNLLFAYSEHSYECLKNCDNGVKPYNNSKVCLTECNNDFPFLERSTKKCYTSCELNDVDNKISDIDQGICTNICKGQTLPGNKCSECKESNMYRNKDGNCVKIPKQCQIVDVNSGLCKVCNTGYYPLKEDLNKNYFNCYKNLEEIIKDLNKTNFYLNETEKYWDECYDSCESCYAYGSENRQRCKKCKFNYHFEYYFENIYNNCRLNLTPNENCTSSQAYMYKYKDFCHLCKEGYSFAYGTDMCMKTEELEEEPFYVNNITIKTGDNKTEEIDVKIFHPCYKLCKKCREKGDFYDNKCISCIDGYKFDKRHKTCILESEVEITDNSDEITDNSDEIISPSSDEEKEEEKKDKTDFETDEIINKETDNINKISDYTNHEEEIDDSEESNEKTEIITPETDNINKISDYINHEDEIDDSEENIWFKLGDDSFYRYQQKTCLIIFYDRKIFLVSNRKNCINICPKWDRFNCQLKNFTRFSNMTREEYDNLIDNSYEYDSLKNNINIVLNVPEKKLYFHLTNYVSKPEKNLSYVDISEYQNLIYKSFSSNILLMKVDIKRSDTQSTQVEYQFYNPNSITEKINLKKFLLKRRLDNGNDDMQLNIDLPVDWTKDQIDNIEYLDSKDIDAFNSSSEFYIDNCNQFTSAKGNDVFLKERKKIYYPDIPLCEKDCSFVKYNSDTQKVTCQCNYKTNSDNFKNVTFVTNPVDKKFLKDLFLENFQTMKCFKVIFKWENLKKNAGFIIMIIFIIIFVGSFVFYFLSGGFLKIHNYRKQVIESNVIKDIIEKAVSEEQNLHQVPKPEISNSKEPKEENHEVKIFVGDKKNNSFENKKSKKDLLDEDKNSGENSKNNSDKNSIKNSDKNSKNNSDKNSIKNSDKNSNYISDKNSDKNFDKQSNSSSEQITNKGGLIDDDGESKEEKGNSSKKGGKRKGEVKSNSGNSKNSNNPLMISEGFPAESVNEFIRKDSQNSKKSAKKDDDAGDNKSQLSNFVPKPKKFKKHQEDKISQYSNLPLKKGYDIDSKYSGNIEYVDYYGKNKIKNYDEIKNSKDRDLIDLDSKQSDKKSNKIINKKNKKDININNNINDDENKEVNDNNHENDKKDKNQDEKSLNSSIEFPINQFNNPFLNSSKLEENLNGSKNLDPQNENNISNLNINSIMKTEKPKQNEKDEVKEEQFKEEEIKEEDIKSQDKSLISSKIEGSDEKHNKKEENEKENVKEKEKKFERQNSDISGFSIEPQKIKNYDKDSDIYSVNSDLISNYSKVDLKSNSSKANPPKRRPIQYSIDSKYSQPKKNESVNNSPNIISSVGIDKKPNNENKTFHNNLAPSFIKDKLEENSSTSKSFKKKVNTDEEEDKKNKNYPNKFGKIGEIFQEKFGFMNEAKITDELLNKNIELLTLDEFKIKYNSFPLIYLADLRKHHLLYFSFFACNDNNNFFLKFAFFSLSINLYFGLNTMLIFDSNMSDAYYDKEKAKPLYILMNLFLPFIICGSISFIIKILIMPSYCINKMIRKIQNNENLKNMIINGEYQKPEEIQVERKGKKKHNIHNKKINNSIREYSPEYQKEIRNLENELNIMSSFHFKKVLIFFIASSILLLWNWYLMTSFCAIFKNTGIKLIVNTIISLLASWILPFIFGLIPSGLGILAVKINNGIIYRIYQVINTIL